MANLPNNLRKAAVLIRSLDESTAAQLLATLPPADAAAVRAAVDSLDIIDPEEQANVAAEMRRVAPVGVVGTRAGVELTLSRSEYTADGKSSTYAQSQTPVVFSARLPRNTAPQNSRFEFLEQAPIANLIPFLAREHSQTIALVLSFLSPTRAASVLAALPPRQQADAVERLSAIGEIDPDSVKIVEQELAAWLAAQSSERRGPRSGAAARAILAAATPANRESILANLKTHKGHLAAQLGDANVTARSKPSSSRPFLDDSATASRFSTQLDSLRATRAAIAQNSVAEAPRQRPAVSPSLSPTPIARPKQQIQFDDLVRLDPRALDAVLHEVDASVLVLALTGSSEELVDRITAQMPKRTAKAFRRQLRKPGPTRLSDVEAAQLAVAEVAAQIITRRAAAISAATK